MSPFLPIAGDHKRADIDGLRAVAVLAVLGFHAFPDAFSGGFVGVDVFFVISGYLISGIIFASIRAGDFRLIDFYARRIRRIFPALLIVLAAVTVAGYFVLFDDEWSELIRQVIAGCTFSSNFLFWSEAGYFDVNSELKPLLHLWSLAIEEQFYLMWPVLLVLGRGPKGWCVLISMALLASLLASLLLSDGNPNAAFYLPGARFWELGVGALLGWLELQASMPTDGPSIRVDNLFKHFQRFLGRDALSLLGLVMIIGSVVCIDRTMIFPGSLVLLPTLGAAALIFAGANAVVNLRLLSRPWAVCIGAMSYPLYLWHWPLLSFSRTILGGEPSATCRLGLLFIAFVLAWATYLAIERPLRLRLSLHKGAGISALAMVAFVGAALILIHAEHETHRTVRFRGESNGLRAENQRMLTWFSADSRCIDDLHLQDEAAIAKDALFCSLNPGTAPIAVMVFGDSTANALYPGMLNIYDGHRQRVLNVGNGTCAPFQGLIGEFEWNRSCADVNRKVYQYLQAHPDLTTVIWSMTSWDIRNMRIPGMPPNPTLTERFAAIRPLVARDLDTLRQEGKRVVVTFDTPLIGINPRLCIANPGRCYVPSKLMDRRMEPYRTKWRALFAGMSGVCEFSQDSIFRQQDGSYTATRDGLLLFRDDHHLSYFGSEIVARAFRQSSCF